MLGNIITCISLSKHFSDLKSIRFSELISGAIHQRQGDFTKENVFICFRLEEERASLTFTLRLPLLSESDSCIRNSQRHSEHLHSRSYHRLQRPDSITHFKYYFNDKELSNQLNNNQGFLLPVECNTIVNTVYFITCVYIFFQDNE